MILTSTTHVLSLCLEDEIWNSIPIRNELPNCFVRAKMLFYKHQPALGKPSRHYGHIWNRGIGKPLTFLESVSMLFQCVFWLISLWNQRPISSSEIWY